jgi:hypothetical protein
MKICMFYRAPITRSKVKRHIWLEKYLRPVWGGKTSVQGRVYLLLNSLALKAVKDWKYKDAYHTQTVIYWLAQYHETHLDILH